MKVYIVGHKNPDTDSVVSAIALAELKKLQGENSEPAIADKINKETAFVLEKFGLPTPQMIPEEEKKVVLVDHNEPSQISENIKTEEIIGIFDHHKLGGLSTSEPIPIIVKPVGSTSTVIVDLYQQNNISIPIATAKILLTGILSDTWKFTSPTATGEDKKASIFLNKIAKLNIDKLAHKMFEAKSDLSGVSIEDIVDKDYKNFNIKGKKVGVGVFETVDPKPALKKVQEINKFLAQKKAKENLEILLFAAVDIINKQAFFIAVSNNEEELLVKAFNVKKENGYLFASGIVSRKKQIIPALEKAL